MTNLPDTLVYSQVYDPLFYKDWSDGGKVKGYLAESYEISEDGLDINVKLRDNVYFHNGYKLTSEDVKFTLMRCSPARSARPCSSTGTASRSSTSSISFSI